MKKISIKIVLALTLATSMGSFVSCRKGNVDVDHHSEAGNVDDNAVDNPSKGSNADSTEIGTPDKGPKRSNTGPAMGEGPGQTVPDSIKPLN